MGVAFEKGRGSGVSRRHKVPRPLPRPLGLPDWCKSLFESQNPPFSAEIRRPFWVTFGGRGLQLRAWLGVKKGGNNAPPPATPPWSWMRWISTDLITKSRRFLVKIRWSS